MLFSVFPWEGPTVGPARGHGQAGVAGTGTGGCAGRFSRTKVVGGGGGRGGGQRERSEGRDPRGAALPSSPKGRQSVSQSVKPGKEGEEYEVRLFACFTLFHLFIGAHPQVQIHRQNTSSKMSSLFKKHITNLKLKQLFL